MVKRKLSEEVSERNRDNYVLLALSDQSNSKTTITHKMDRFKKPNGLSGSASGSGSPGPKRLASFKGKRDLSLGGTSKPGTGASGKAKFTPNLVARRNKPAATPMVTEVKKETGASPASKRKDKKPDFKPKPRAELIQTMGSVFSDGINADGIRRKPGGFGGGSSRAEGEAELRRPVLSQKMTKVDKEAEERRLQALLKDDFLDDLTTGGVYPPVQLPMVDTGKLFKQEEDSEKEEDEELAVGKSQLVRKRHNRIKDSDDEDEEGVDPLAPKGEHGAVKAPVKSVIAKAETDELTFSDLVRRQKGDLLFIQLPDHLPGAPPPDGNKEGQARVEEKLASCKLSDLPEGYLGKIQIRKSGKVQLQIGKDLLDVDLGAQVRTALKFFRNCDVNDIRFKLTGWFPTRPGIRRG